MGEDYLSSPSICQMSFIFSSLSALFGATIGPSVARFCAMAVGSERQHQLDEGESPHHFSNPSPHPQSQQNTNAEGVYSAETLPSNYIEEGLDRGYHNPPRPYASEHIKFANPVNGLPFNWYNTVALDAQYYNHLTQLRYSEQLVYIATMHKQGLLSDLQYALLSLCGVRYPTQVPYNPLVCLQVASLCYTSAFGMQLEAGKNAGACPPDFGTLSWCKENYEVKKHPGAAAKQGCHAHDVMQGLRDHHPNLWALVTRYWFMWSGLSDDQVACTLVYLVVLSQHVAGQALVMLAVMPVRTPDIAKSVSVALKGLGYNASLLGATLVEAHVLVGRGVGTVELCDEVARRCGDDGRATVVDLPQDELQAAIRKCFDLELETFRVEDFAVWYARRWGKMANGSHSRTAARRYPRRLRKQAEATYLNSRSHRKAVLEAWDLQDVMSWTGDVLVSPSLKMEHAKTRALFSCDTLSSLYFTWLLSQCEDKWRNIDAILDPGRMGTIGMGALLYKMKQNNPVMLMADYDDFNSQHSLEAQKLVISELCLRVGVSDDMTRLLVGSFDTMYIIHDKQEHRVTGTLMSGHRGTSFINTVLNFAYMEVVHVRCGVQRVAKHVGDDIAAGYKDHDDAAAVLDMAAELKLRLNAIKQSCGKFAMEFLRVAYDMRGNGYGYVTRAIASYVSGNWATTHILDGNEVVTNGIASVYTISNRAGMRSLYKLFVFGFCRRTQLSIDIGMRLLSGSLSCDGSPVFGNPFGRLVHSVELQPDKQEKYLREIRSRESKASCDYLTTLEDSLDRQLAEKYPDVTILALMASSHYKDVKSDINPGDGNSGVRIASERIIELEGSVNLTHLMATKPERSELGESELNQILARTYGNEAAYGMYLSVGGSMTFHRWHVATYKGKKGYNVFNSSLSWADMCQYNGRIMGMKVIHDYGAFFV